MHKANIEAKLKSRSGKDRPTAKDFIDSGIGIDDNEIARRLREHIHPNDS